MSNKKVAIIGSGPAGLAAAKEVVKAGFEVTVFEKADRPGGLLMYGIPHMKLDKSNIMKRAKALEAEGVVFVLNKEVNKEVVEQEISKDFDAVILAFGAEKPRDLEIDGREVENVYFAMDYLVSHTKAHLDNIPLKIDAKGKNVLVLGGGDTGADCVATAIDQGCKSVKQISRSPKKNRKPNDYGYDEVMIKRYQRTPIQLISKNGKLEKAMFRNDTVFFENDNDMPNYELYDVDLIFIALGFLGPVEEGLEAFDVDHKKVDFDEQDYTTNQENVFICGDARIGASLIKYAIMDGKNAAIKTIEYLNK